MHPILERTFRTLRAWPQGGGLEIADTALRYAEWSGKAWRTAAVRLPPGLMRSGKILDRGGCIDAFSSFRAEIAKNPDPRATVAVVASLSAARVYTHTFTLPRVEGVNLAEAVELNLQIASPFDAGAAHSGWQYVGKDDVAAPKRDILGAFIDRTLADDMIAVLAAAGFIPRSLESGAFSLARCARERGAGFLRDVPTLIVHVDESGFEFLITENGALAFHYFTPWSDLQGDAKEVAWDVFAVEFRKNLRQVLNYADAHRKEPIKNVFLAASALGEGVAALLAENPGLAVHSLALMDDAAPLGPEWFIAIGSGLRGMIAPREDREVSLLGVTARAEFWRYQITRFIRFWRVLVPATLLVFLGIGMAVDVWLVRERRAVEEEARAAERADRAAAIAGLEKAAVEFNETVAITLQAVGSREPRSMIAADMQRALAARSIEIIHLGIEPNGVVNLSAYAPSEADIRGLAEDLGAAGRFLDVNVPFAGIKPEGSKFSFSLSATRVAPTAVSTSAR